MNRIRSLLVEVIPLRIVALPEHHHLREVGDAALREGFPVVQRSEGSSVQYEFLPAVGYSKVTSVGGKQEEINEFQLLSCS